MAGHPAGERGARGSVLFHPQGDVYLIETEEIQELQTVRNVLVPKDVTFRQLLVTGPPGSGKSTLVTKLGGWPEEGYLDLADPNWWHSRILTFRPREVHLGIPVMGREDSMAVFDRGWLEADFDIDFERIRIPPSKRGLFTIDWRNRYVFDFQLLPIDLIYSTRKAHGRSLHRLEDVTLTRAMVERQVAAYAAVAGRLHCSGLRVYVREAFGGPPRRIV